MDKALRKFIQKQRPTILEILEKYSLFLEENGYMDIDWRTEPPFAIEEFLKTLTK